jgi:hypothetical protein
VVFDECCTTPQKRSVLEILRLDLVSPRKEKC